MAYRLKSAKRRRKAKQLRAVVAIGLGSLLFVFQLASLMALALLVDSNEAPSEVADARGSDRPSVFAEQDSYDRFMRMYTPEPEPIRVIVVEK